jgi:hypothetical protein
LRTVTTFSADLASSAFGDVYDKDKAKP